MPTTPHRIASITLQKELYSAHERMLNSGPSYAKFCAMVYDLLKRVVPLIWPKATPAKLKAVSVYVPLVDCYGHKKSQEADARRIEKSLLKVFPTGAARTTKPAASAKRTVSPKR